ncbi:MAG: flagellar biosynthesis anti-sigma factor FlgM [Pseudomonadota bacterium]
MAHTTKYNTPHRSNVAGAPVPVLANGAGSLDAPMSPRVEALKKLVASGKYQVSSRYLAHQIMRAAGITPV